MVTDAEGPISKKAEVLAASLADCPAFISWTGESGAANALANRIHFGMLPPPAEESDEGDAVYDEAELEAYRPYALISTNQIGGLIRRHVSTGDSFDFVDSGSLLIHLVETIPDSLLSDPAETERLFENTVGKIMDELCERAGQGGFSAFNQIELEDDVSRAHPDMAMTRGEVHHWDLVVTYQNSL